MPPFHIEKNKINNNPDNSSYSRNLIRSKKNIQKPEEHQKTRGEIITGGTQIIIYIQTRSAHTPAPTEELALIVHISHLCIFIWFVT